ncbi:MAG: VCBS repeat-containing protein, partial [Chlorobi bacterium]|nr:VCBS repeat-containing protein [Chlorobiota bacterium]
MKKIFITIILTFIFFGEIHSQKEYIKWEKLASPSVINPIIVSGKSLSDFWILDSKGILFHFKEKKWIDFPLKTEEDLSQIKISKTDENSFLLAGIDNSWRTHIYHFKNGKWSKDSLIIKNPITQILILNKNDIYLGGNWATFYRYRNEKWEQINCPFKNHLNMAADKNGKIWFGVRGEGVFSYDGKSFEKYRIEDNLKTDIYIRANQNGSIMFRVSNGEEYYFDGVKFVKEKVTKNKKDNAPFGYEKVDIPETKESITVPGSLRFNLLKRLDDGSILLTTKENALYAANISGNNFFEDLSLAYKVEGHKNSASNGAAFIYFDDDNLPDIFTFNDGHGEYSELYRNKLGRPFIEASEKIESLLSPESFLFAFGDFNGDLRTDFATMEFKSKGSFVRTFFQEADGKFVNGQTIFPLEEYNSKPYQNIRLIDFDEDGRLDMDISTFFGNGMNKGNQLLLMNKGLSGPIEYDTSIARFTRGWTSQSIFADFNSDGENDFLLLKEWESPKLLLHLKENIEIISLPVNDSVATLGALAFDYDNDGDLDLLTTSDEKIISVFNNNSKGVFTDVTKNLKLKYFNSKPNNIGINRSLSCGDFNNDGYVDLFLSLEEPGNKRNYLFINDSGRAFVEVGKKYSIARPYVNGAVVGDVDGDGDLDIYGFREGFNTLWVNNLNDKNYLVIIPYGIKSNYDALGAKVTVFTAGKGLSENALLGFRQIGSEQFGKNRINQRLAHFGLSAEGLYDVKIEFYGGETKILKNVKAGQTIEAFEITGLSAAVYLLPGKILRFVSSTENQLYIIITIVAFFVLIFGVRFGVKRYRWSSATTTAIILVNVSIFWLMIFLSLNSDSYFTKYILPLIVMVSGLLLPHFIFFSITRNPFSNKSKKEVEENLLRKMMLFTHGEWALRNLSGLQLLMQNVPDN